MRNSLQIISCSRTDEAYLDRILRERNADKSLDILSTMMGMWDGVAEYGIVAQD